MYEAYSDYESMMNMAEEIVTRCAVATHGKLKIDYQVLCFYSIISFGIRKGSPDAAVKLFPYDHEVMGSIH
jgi:hypothetical protein